MKFLQFVLAATALVAGARGVEKNFLSNRPAWLSEASVTLKESYDDNVFLAGTDRLVAYKLPRGSVAALANRESWVTTVAPKIGFNLARSFDAPALDVLSFGYAPEIATYHDVSSESHVAHRVPVAFKAHAQDVTVAIENAFTFIDGEQHAPLYPGALLSAYGTGAPRERREQWQDRASVTLQFTREKWFVRPTAALIYYDLLTAQENTPGYQNYPDRSDVNGGLDLGYKVLPPLALTLGYRFGHQYQDQFTFSPYSSSCDYQRVLGGIEGKLFPWLDVKVQAGPDFRDYQDDSRGHITPVDNNQFTTLYADASATATISTNDAVSFRFKRFLWLSSIGKVPYIDTTYELVYRRQIIPKLSAELTGRMLNADYSPGSLPACKRDDWQYSVCIAATYALNSHASITAGYSLDLGRNAQQNLIHGGSREFDRNLASLGATLKF